MYSHAHSCNQCYFITQFPVGHVLTCSLMQSVLFYYTVSSWACTHMLTHAISVILLHSFQLGMYSHAISVILLHSFQLGMYSHAHSCNKCYFITQVPVGHVLTCSLMQSVLFYYTVSSWACTHMLTHAISVILLHRFQLGMYSHAHSCNQCYFITQFPVGHVLTCSLMQSVLFITQFPVGHVLTCSLMQ